MNEVRPSILVTELPTQRKLIKSAFDQLAYQFQSLDSPRADPSGLYTDQLELKPELDIAVALQGMTSTLVEIQKSTKTLT